MDTYFFLPVVSPVAYIVEHVHNVLRLNLYLPIKVYKNVSHNLAELLRT